MNTLLAKFIALAATKHQDQLDKSGKPYILHCLTVMNGVMKKYPDDFELMCIAVGHDLIEDTDTTFTELRELGATQRIVEGINHLTKYSGQTYEEYVDDLKNNNDAIIVKLEDLRHNKYLMRLNRYATLFNDLSHIVRK
jgi:(p)ppGpp synthase/HD superfamily hydrolase